MNRLIIVLFLAILFTGSPVRALEGEPATQFVLDGLKSVHVSVSPLNKLSLKGSEIKSAVEDRFSKSGMKIIGEKEFLNYTDVDQFLIKVKPYKHKNQVFYSLTLSLTQMVFFENKPNRRISVTSWQDEVVGLVDTKSEEQIKIKILEKVDSFIDLWKRANGIVN